MPKPVILVVDDEEDIRTLVAEVLTDLDYTTAEAEDAASALVVLEHTSDVRIVITDINMPGNMDGVELAATVRERWPHIEFIITSGRATNVRVPDGGVFLQKPFRLASLVSTIRSMFEGAGRDAEPCR